MLSNISKALGSVVGSLSTQQPEPEHDEGPLPKFEYSRPDFLGLSADEFQVSSDHQARPIIVPRDVCRLPWKAGYAEVINTGKSIQNEDQASCEVFSLVDPEEDPLVLGHGHGVHPYPPNYETGQPRYTSFKHVDPISRKAVYFGIFDGHAGSEAAVYASKLLHYFIQEKVSSVQALFFNDEQNHEHVNQNGWPDARVSFADLKDISKDELVIGALECAFHAMDSQIGRERKTYRIAGGCAVVVAMFFLDKLYVANAGDCRAVICRQGKATTMSTDFTPDTERQRLQFLAWMHPHLLGNEFTHLDFANRLSTDDIGRRVLYREAHMSGWAYKIATEEDIKFPLVFREGKKTRLMATIGLTRGFGDHDLKVHDTGLFVKPFLSATPEVQIYDISEQPHTYDDVLILASDGLWDVVSSQKAAELVTESLSQFSPDEPTRYTSAAQELVMYARGLLLPKYGWRTVDNKPSSIDDISVFVIPLCCYGSNAQTPVSPRLTVGRPADWKEQLDDAVDQSAAAHNDGSFVDDGQMAATSKHVSDLSHNQETLPVEQENQVNVEDREAGSDIKHVENSSSDIKHTNDLETNEN